MAHRPATRAPVGAAGGAAWLVGAGVLDGRFRLRFFGQPRPVEVTGIETAARARHPWGWHAVTLHGDIVLRPLHNRRPLQGFPRAPGVHALPTPVLGLVSPREGR